MSDCPPSYSDQITVKLTFFDVLLSNQTHIMIKDDFGNFFTKLINKQVPTFNILWPTSDNSISIMDVMTCICPEELGWLIDLQTIDQLSGRMWKGKYANFVQDGKLYIHMDQRMVIRFDVSNIELETVKVLSNEVVQLKNKINELEDANAKMMTKLKFFTEESGLFFKMLVDKCLMDWKPYEAEYRNGRIYYTFDINKLEKPLETDFALVQKIVVNNYYIYNRETILCHSCYSGKARNCGICTSSNYYRLKYVLSIIKDNGLKDVMSISLLDNVAKQCKEESIRTPNKKLICSSHNYSWEGKPELYKIDHEFDVMELEILQSVKTIKMNKIEVYYASGCEANNLGYNKNNNFGQACYVCIDCDPKLYASLPNVSFE